MGSSQQNKSRVPLSPSLWLVTLARQLRRAATRVHTIETKAEPARERARDWLGKAATQAKTTAGVAAAKTAVVLVPAAKETKRGLRLLDRRARHTAALVGIPWLKVGVAAVVLVGVGFVAFQPRGERGRTPAERGPAVARQVVPAGATESQIAPVANPTTIAAANALPSANARASTLPPDTVQRHSPPAKKQAVAKPAKRQLSAKERNRERRKQAHYKQAEKWYKKHSKRGKKGDDD